MLRWGYQCSIEVLVSAEYIRAISYHMGQVFVSTHGTIVREYEDGVTGELWIVFDFGTNEIEV